MPNLPIAHKDPKLPQPMAVLDGSEWKGMLTRLDANTAETLAAAMRTLCPHDRLPERIYRRVVLVFDRLAGDVPGTAGLLAEFVQKIDTHWPLRFLELSEGF